MINASAEGLFWLCAVCIAYTYAGYPLLMGLRARYRGRPLHPAGKFSGSVSIVLVVHNEGSSMDRRLGELTSLLAASARNGEILVVSDGSTDHTVAKARAHETKRVRVLELPVNVGKAEALTRGCAAATGDVLIFADARQRWAPDALEKILFNFTVPEVGAVSGNLVIESAPGVMAGVGLYWRFEKWLRRMESRVHSTVGATGSISAVRRQLFVPIPRGTLVDDVYWPLNVVMQGYRVVQDEGVIAYDRLPERTHDEFQRKVRTLSGNYQLLVRLPAAVLPWRNPVWLEFISHKIMRLLVPWALLGALFTSFVLPHPLYTGLFYLQGVFYSAGVAGILLGTRLSSRVTAAAGAFLVLNAAAWLAFWFWISGRTGKTWRKARYAENP